MTTTRTIHLSDGSSIQAPDPPHFSIYETGDPYGRTWDATENTSDPDRGIFRGDLSGLYGKLGLIRALRRLYPGCRIFNRW